MSQPSEPSARGFGLASSGTAAVVLTEWGHVVRHTLGFVHGPHVTALATEVVVDMGVLARVLEPAGVA